MLKKILYVGASLMLLNSCSGTGEIEVHQAWVRPTPQGENAAVYFTIHNHSRLDDEFTGATATIVDVIEIHKSTMEADVMNMDRIDSVPIAAGEEIIFTPGGLHLMLVNIKQEFTLGSHIGLILHFRDRDDIVVEVQIENTIPEEDHDH
jgi:copper(I)-binding protein